MYSGVGVLLLFEICEFIKSGDLLVEVIDRFYDYLC